MSDQPARAELASGRVAWIRQRTQNESAVSDTRFLLSQLEAAEAQCARLGADLDATLDHLDKAREAIANAQQWADKWKAHAFEVQAECARLREALEDALTLAKEATNGWGCHAKRMIEHADIARLHRGIAALSAGDRLHIFEYPKAKP